MNNERLNEAEKNTQIPVVSVHLDDKEHFLLKYRSQQFTGNNKNYIEYTIALKTALCVIFKAIELIDLIFLTSREVLEEWRWLGDIGKEET